MLTILLTVSTTEAIVNEWENPWSCPPSEMPAVTVTVRVAGVIVVAMVHLLALRQSCRYFFFGLGCPLRAL